MIGNAEAQIEARRAAGATAQAELNEALNSLETAVSGSD